MNWKWQKTLCLGASCAALAMLGLLGGCSQPGEPAGSMAAGQLLPAGEQDAVGLVPDGSAPGGTASGTLAPAQPQAAAGSEAAPAPGTAGDAAGTAAPDAAQPARGSGQGAAAENTAAENGAAGMADKAAWQAEVDALTGQLYAVRDQALRDLNACIAEARAEYHALPESQQTTMRKIAICVGKTGQLNALQSACDQQVESIVAQMRQVLLANGQSTALADQAMQTYKDEKSAMYASLAQQLYG